MANWIKVEIPMAPLTVEQIKKHMDDDCRMTFDITVDMSRLHEDSLSNIIGEDVSEDSSDDFWLNFSDTNIKAMSVVDEGKAIVFRIESFFNFD